jgi:hypothetical protein
MPNSRIRAFTENAMTPATPTAMPPNAETPANTSPSNMRYRGPDVPVAAARRALTAAAGL